MADEKKKPEAAKPATATLARRKPDPELKALGRIADILSELTPEQAVRVAEYASKRAAEIVSKANLSVAEATNGTRL